MNLWGKSQRLVCGAIGSGRIGCRFVREEKMEALVSVRRVAEGRGMERLGIGE